MAAPAAGKHVCRTLCLFAALLCVLMGASEAGQGRLSTLAALDREEPEFTPEYEDELEQVALFIDRSDMEAVSTQIDLMRALPDYTQILVLVESDDDVEFLRRNLPLEVYSRVRSVQPEEADYRVWARDYCAGYGRIKLLPWWCVYGGKVDMARGVRTFLRRTGSELRRIPVLFDGGNVLLARDNSGENVLLAGADTYFRTADFFASLNVRLSERGFTEIAKGAFGVDRVVVLDADDGGGAAQQQFPLLHLDQIMLPVADGLLAMECMECSSGAGTSELGAALAAYRNAVEEAGFSVIELPTDEEHVANTQSYVNAIVYTDRTSGQRCVIMPIFPCENGQYRMEGLNLANMQAFEAAGLAVTVVRDALHHQGGSLHCISLR